MRLDKPALFPRFDGQAHRLIDLRSTASDTVTAWVEDDFHHFGVQVSHVDNVIIDISVRAKRFPYTSCGGAEQSARELIGASLTPRASDVGRWISMRHQCTHIYDLLGLASAHAALKREPRQYLAIIDDRRVLDVDVSGRRTLEPGRAALLKNGTEVLVWGANNSEIIDPPEWRGQSLNKGFRERTESMPIEYAEYANILRRAIMVAGGRSANRDTAILPRDNKKPALCYTYQPAQRAFAEWIPSSLRDWSDQKDQLLICSDFPTD